VNDRVLSVNPGHINGRVALSKDVLCIEYDPEAGSEAGDEHALPVPLQPSTRSALSVPMVCGVDVDLVGVISVESDTPDAFNERDVRVLSTIATQAAIGIRQAELYEGSQRANQLKQEFIAAMSHARGSERKTDRSPASRSPPCRSALASTE
jgi:GAF domain-containing protein